MRCRSGVTETSFCDPDTTASAAPLHPRAASAAQRLRSHGASGSCRTLTGNAQTVDVPSGDATDNVPYRAEDVQQVDYLLAGEHGLDRSNLSKSGTVPYLLSIPWEPPLPSRPPRPTPPPRPSAPPIWTRLPGAKRNWPSVTTVSPV